MRRHLEFWRALTVAATALFVDACAVGPDFERPSAPDLSGYTRSR
jgi:hypothetical protein